MMSLIKIKKKTQFDFDSVYKKRKSTIKILFCGRFNLCSQNDFIFSEQSSCFVYCFCFNWPVRLLLEPRPCQYERYHPWQHLNHNRLTLDTVLLAHCQLQTWIMLLNCTRNRAWHDNKQTMAKAFASTVQSTAYVKQQKHFTQMACLLLLK